MNQEERAEPVVEEAVVAAAETSAVGAQRGTDVPSSTRSAIFVRIGVLLSVMGVTALAMESRNRGPDSQKTPAAKAPSSEHLELVAKLQVNEKMNTQLLAEVRALREDLNRTTVETAEHRRKDRERRIAPHLRPKEFYAAIRDSIHVDPQNFNTITFTLPAEIDDVVPGKDISFFMEMPGCPLTCIDEYVEGTGKVRRIILPETLTGSDGEEEVEIQPGQRIVLGVRSSTVGETSTLASSFVILGKSKAADRPVEAQKIEEKQPAEKP